MSMTFFKAMTERSLIREIQINVLRTSHTT